MNFQKKSRTGNEKRIYKIIKCFEKKSAKKPKLGTTFSRKLPINRMLFKYRDEKKNIWNNKFQKKI